VHRVARAQRATKGFLTLSTIHGAKGKEWDTVFVAGVNADVLPHKKGEFEEERRIYFVAITRPRKRLHVSANGIPSQFIEAELPSKNGEAVATVDKFEGFRLHSQELKHVPQGFGNTSN
jgi:superfamily I DNA/RNA helicase